MHYRNDLRRTRERIIEAAVRKLELRQAAHRAQQRLTRTSQTTRDLNR